MKVLFFTPYFGKTGSEICLFDLLTQADNKYFETGICVMNGSGELVADLPFAVSHFNYLRFREEKIAELNRNNTLPARLVRLLNPFNRISSKTGIANRYDAKYFIQHIIQEFKPDVCYVNTITLFEVIEVLNGAEKIILHSHESENMLSGLSTDRLKLIFRKACLIISPSEKTVRMFNLLGRNQDIELFHSPVNFDRIKVDENRISALKAVNGINKDCFIWVMSGTVDPNKDAVAFIELAKSVSAKNPGVLFMWLGKGTSAYADYCKALANSYGLKNNLLWVEPDDIDYYNYFNMASGFILTSRQDTFPLVMLEAAYLKKPIVSFDSGGIGEFLGEKFKNFIVRGRNLIEMAELMEKIMSGEVSNTGLELRQLAENYSTKNSFKKWVELITNKP